MESWAKNGQFAPSRLQSIISTASPETPATVTETATVTRPATTQPAVSLVKLPPDKNTNAAAACLDKKTAGVVERMKQPAGEEAFARPPLPPDPETSSHSQRLIDYRQKLARDISARVALSPAVAAAAAASASASAASIAPVASPAKRPSPIEEEDKHALHSTLSTVTTKTTTTPAAAAAAAAAANLHSTPPASSESAQTVRGDNVKQSAPALPTRPPSYPFPRMNKPGRTPLTAPPPLSSVAVNQLSTHGHFQPSKGAPETAIAAAEAEKAARNTTRRLSSQRHESFSGLSERVLSTPSTPTPASAATFFPSSMYRTDAPPPREYVVPLEPAEHGRSRTIGDVSSRPHPTNRDFSHSHPDFPSPSLYDLSLALIAEPGLDAWWSTVIDIATDWYRAERVTLSVPSDATDVENMPWGQKATFNAREHDDKLSLAYLGRASSSGPDPIETDLPESVSAQPEPGLPLRPQTPPPPQPWPSQHRPSLASRHSYTAYEDHKEQTAEILGGTTEEESAAIPPRPTFLRCQTTHVIPTTQRSDVPTPSMSAATAAPATPTGLSQPRPYASLNHATLEELNAAEGTQVPLPLWGGMQELQKNDVRGRVLPVLQALDYEADPLIDHNGVQRVLGRGQLVTLTRSYPYGSPVAEGQPKESKSKPAKQKEVTPSTNAPAPAPVPAPAPAPTSAPSLAPASAPASTFVSTNSPSAASLLRDIGSIGSHRKLLAGAGMADGAGKPDGAALPRSSIPTYEEYEQTMPSPWSQSPAPSPAARPDFNESPFFGRAATVDEDSFEPDSSPEDYTETQPSRAIGLDHAWTVLHIPLFHPILSKQAPSFKLDASKMQRRSSPQRRPNSRDQYVTDSDTDSPVVSPFHPPVPEPSATHPKRTPIAILSILSPVIPYPSNLRQSLQHLAPHVASSFSLCSHYTNLKKEVIGLQHRRHDINGFGGVDTNGFPLKPLAPSISTPYPPSEDAAMHRSLAGSMTSYSDYSLPSRSAVGSPGITPGWEANSLGQMLEKRSIPGAFSPGFAPFSGDGYFGSRPAAAMGLFGRAATTPGGSSPGGGVGGGGGSGAGAGGGGIVGVQRVRKISTAQTEKRLSSLRTRGLSNTARDRETETQSATSVTDTAAGGPFVRPLSALSLTSTTVEPTQLQVPQQLVAESADKGSAKSQLEASVASSHGKAFFPAQKPVDTSIGDQPLHGGNKGDDTMEANLCDKNNLGASSAPGIVPAAAAFPPRVSTPGTQTQYRHIRQYKHRGFHRHSQSHSQLHSHGADFAATFPSLPPSSSIAVRAGTGGDTDSGVPPTAASSSQTGSVASQCPVDMPPPSERLKGLILDSLPAHIFVAMPQTGAIVWVNSRYLAYRGQTVEGLAEDPWASLHPDDRADYLKEWSHSVRSGDQFSRTVRIRRFDGAYRWFQARAVASRDRRNTIVQFLGSYMDIHDQYIAELKAARKEEIEASEAKHRLLANLIPQIIFTANEEEGITFANEQWLLYTGQDFNRVLGLGFMDFVHPDDLAKCSFLPIPPHLQKRRQRLLAGLASSRSEETRNSLMQQDWSNNDNNSSTEKTSTKSAHNTQNNIKADTDKNSSSGGSALLTADANGDEGLSELAALARRGIIMVTTDDNGRPSYTTEIRLRSKTGEYRWHLVRCVETGTMDFGKGYNSYFGSATDINDHKVLETRLKEAMDSKTRFLSNMSHEIRTPLIGISGMVSFLQDTTLNEEQRDYTNTIQTSANSLLMIINDILDLSKVDAGMMKLNYEWFHTRSLIEDVNELVSTMAVAKGLELNYIVEADVPDWVKGDRVRIRQILLNVIGNAIKFTSRGEVFSRCCVVQPSSARGVPSNTTMLEFTVTDTGQGFTEEEAKLIFKPFSQIDGSSTRQYGGSGLGLVISRQLVELHNGKMSGTAIPGKGSTFTFTAQFGLPEESDHPDELATPPPEAIASTNAILTAMGMNPSSRATPLINAAAAAVAAAAAANVTGNGTTHLDPAVGLRSVDDGSKGGAVVHSTGTISETSGTAGTATAALASSNADGVVTVKTPQSSMFSILIICAQMHSREATAKHIEMTIPKGMPHQITALATAAEAQALFQSRPPTTFTHVVINLPSAQEILCLVEQISQSPALKDATVLLLSDSVQRQTVNKLAAGTHYEKLLSDMHHTFIYKPVKPSRFAVIFDPAKERDLSVDHNRSNAQRLVETQKQSYLDLEHRMGNKGYKVLLVEDNILNQKVLKKYLSKVGVAVDMAADGVECTDTIRSRPHDYYSLVLCDLHMPRKDGYQACREIREWEAALGVEKQIPVIALSANVMSDVYNKCMEAGFNKYITKPVDFVDLSRALSHFF